MVFATNNIGKLEEIKDILSEYKIASLKERKITYDGEEDSDSFFGNASKKAKEIYELVHEETIADDSGLCIDALNGFPGVKTHRFLGEDATDDMRNRYLIKEVDKYKDRSAQVVCVLAYYDGKKTLYGEGVLKGTIAKEGRGENGFGFDKIFELPNGKTLAELTKEEKNKVSARYLAAQDLKRKIDKEKSKQENNL